MPNGTITLFRVPEDAPSPEDSRKYLIDFVNWLQEYIHEISEEVTKHNNMYDKNDTPLFDEELIKGLPDALKEINTAEQFEDLIKALKSVQLETLQQHGLTGDQLKWKLSNIRIRFERFLVEKTAPLLDHLLSTVDILLKSLLGAVPGSDAIEELKEMIKDALALVAPG